MHYLIRDRNTQKYADRRSNWREKVSWTTEVGRVFVQNSIFETSNHIRTLEGFGIDVSSFEMVSIEDDVLRNLDSL